MNGKRRHLKFSVPMVWREPKNNYDDCYFCNLHGANRKKRPIPIWNPLRDLCLLLRQHHQNPYLLLKPLHNGNKHGAVPIAHSTKLKEEYQNKFLVLEKLKYHATKSIIYEYIIIWIRWATHMMADYCWGIMRECPEEIHSKK
jgi:hypothetical protein